MGGRIWVASQVGKGSQFHVDVALESGDPAPVAAEASAWLPGVLKGTRVLVVDDNRTNRRILEGL